MTTATTTRFDERTWLGWLVRTRVLIITCLLVIELAMTRLAPAGFAEREFVMVVVAWYAVSAAYIALLQLWGDSQTQAKLQIATDLAFATALVHFSGGINTRFNFLYPLIIIVACVLLPRLWAFATALLAFILFGAAVELSYFGVLPSHGGVQPEPRSLVVTIFVNLFGYLTIAFLAQRLAAKLHQTGAELHDTSHALENLQALHQKVIRSMTGGLITTDEEGRMVLLNPAGARMLGRTEKSVMSQPVANIFSDRLPAIEATAVRCEARSRTPQGKDKLFGMTIAPIIAQEDGQPGVLTGYIYTFTDLTEVRRLEREVRTRERLSALGRMAEGIAHEIRQPLASITGSLKVLAAIAALNEEESRLVDIVTRESVRLNNIISDFSNYAREKTCNMARIDLRVLLEDTLTLVENRIAGDPSHAAVQVVRAFAPEHAFTMADGDRLKQVFWNICNNALRAMPEGGKLTVSLRESGEAGQWIVGFADTGTGMTPQQMEKIFEPYQSWFQSGTGLGLAISYQIIQAHDGKISVRSAPGEGCEFVLELKQSDADAIPASASSDAQSAPQAADHRQLTTVSEVSHG
jgi:two-component system sensor histidine kinase PilS (NtrC family)